MWCNEIARDGVSVVFDEKRRMEEAGDGPLGKGWSGKQGKKRAKRQVLGAVQMWRELKHCGAGQTSQPQAAAITDL